MKKIVLISCVSKKRTAKSKARDLYVSPLFKLNLQYACALKPDAIFILSAKHGLVALDEEIEPYDVTLINMGVTERKAWAGKIIQQLRLYADLRQDFFVILAGERYRQYLLPHLNFYEIPLKGLSIGRQLQYLKSQVCDE